MTVPEEGRPKTHTTDEVVGQPAEQRDDNTRTRRPAEGRTMREAMEEAGIEPQDFEDL
jgi:hypothetical protein